MGLSRPRHLQQHNGASDSFTPQLTLLLQEDDLDSEKPRPDSLANVVPSYNRCGDKR